jgi:hypothetical protein
LVPANRNHDVHPDISPAGLFWVVPVPEGGLTISPDGRSATLVLRDLAIVDQPKFPVRTPSTPGTLSLRVVWTATGEQATFTNPAKHFMLNAIPATAQVEAEIAVPSQDFSWKSDALETSSAAFAIIGNETNGFFFDTQMPNLVGKSVDEARAILASLGVTNIQVDLQTRDRIPDVFDRFPAGAVVSHLPAPARPLDPSTMVILGVRAP